jgi:transcriptional regulator with XRE-family HTH domain
MITIQQIKAARALLNWKQRDLAEASGISIPAIAKIEMGHGNPRQTTMTALQNAFENSGLEFLGTHGVDQRQEKFSLEVLHGKKSIEKIWADVENVFGDGSGGELLLGNLDERIFIKHYNKDMKRVLQGRRKLNITSRALVREGEDFFLMPLEWHRTVPKAVFAQILYWVYADRVVINDFSDNPRFIWIQSQSLANAFRKQFEYNWSAGRRIDPKKATLWQL